MTKGRVQADQCKLVTDIYLTRKNASNSRNLGRNRKGAEREVSLILEQAQKLEIVQLVAVAESRAPAALALTHRLLSYDHVDSKDNGLGVRLPLD